MCLGAFVLSTRFENAIIYIILSKTGLDVDSILWIWIMRLYVIVSQNLFLRQPAMCHCASHARFPSYPWGPHATSIHLKNMEVSMAMGVPQNGWFISWNIPFKWRITRGPPVLGNTHHPMSPEKDWILDCLFINLANANGSRISLPNNACPSKQCVSIGPCFAGSSCPTNPWRTREVFHIHWRTFSQKLIRAWTFCPAHPASAWQFPWQSGVIWIPGWEGPLFFFFFRTFGKTWTVHE